MFKIGDVVELVEEKCKDKSRKFFFSHGKREYEVIGFKGNDRVIVKDKYGDYHTWYFTRLRLVVSKEEKLSIKHSWSWLG